MLKVNFVPPGTAERSPAIFLDRDGVINQRIEKGYVLTVDQFKFLPRIISALQALSSLNVPLILISNQAAISKGLLSVPELWRITFAFREHLVEQGVRLDAVYYCPHRPEDNCTCRKPKPGLLQAAASDWNLDLTRSVLVGDSITDVQAAAAAGCHSVLLRGTDDGRPGVEAAMTTVVQTADELHDVVARLIGAYPARP
jgi:D-glycero-D-manno-heptose 1,7-bisphosphate phosphatase